LGAMRTSLSDLLATGRVLLADGATGTNYMVAGLGPGEPPEFWTYDRPDDVMRLHQQFVDAGAYIIGTDDVVERIKTGWLEFDRVVATPDMMGSVGKLGKILGPRGLMPNPKVGTVTFDVAKAVNELKAGKVEFRVEKAGIVHSPVGKVSFGAEKLLENVTALIETIIKLKPASSKGTYLKSISISTTMGPGIKVDPLEVRNI